MCGAERSSLNFSRERNASVDIIASLIVGLSSASVVTAITTFLRNYRAERALINQMKKDENQEQILGALEITRRSLESRTPDPEAVAMATALLGIAAEGLSESKKKDILGLLAHGSEKSKANYIAKIIDEAEIEHAS